MVQLRLVVLPISIISLVFFGLIAGFFYAYSVDVMRGLDLLPPQRAIEAMQVINTAVRNPVFFATFFLTPVIGMLTAALYLLTSSRSAAAFMTIASATYFFGAFIPTAMINVPMNEALAAVDVSARSLEFQSIWKQYSADWTFWNTFRTLASTAALMAAGLAISVKK